MSSAKYRIGVSRYATIRFFQANKNYILYIFPFVLKGAASGFHRAALNNEPMNDQT
jgi:hypothetical protein